MRRVFAGLVAAFIVADLTQSGVMALLAYLAVVAAIGSARKADIG